MAKALAVGAHLLGDAGVPIQKLAMAARIQKPLPGMLPVDIHQGFAQGPERRHRGESPAGVRPGPSVPEQVTAQDQRLSRLEGDPLTLKQLHRPRCGTSIERSLYRRLFRPSPEESLAASGPQDELQRVDQDGLSRPRLPRQDVQAREEGDGHLVDHGNVSDRQFAQHFGDRGPRLRPRGDSYRSPHLSLVRRSSK